MAHHVWTNEEEWLVAKDREDVKRLLTEVVGEEDARDMLPDFKPLPAGSTLVVKVESMEELVSMEKKLGGSAKQAEQVRCSSCGDFHGSIAVSATVEDWVACFAVKGPTYGDRLIATTFE